ncbi:glycosyltransferase family 61 protein [Neobacillus drentensis]|uniref:glycosyltransferase family 61 protein n=1 Tax=Neobacillus drentensis TaxID=220684 RepID=UPI003000F16A
MKKRSRKSLPDGFYEYAWQWVDKYYQPDCYMDIHPKHEITFTLPKCLQEDWADVFELESSMVTTYGAFITAIPRGRLIGDGSRCAVISQDNKLIHDISHSGESDPMQHWIFQKKRLPKKKFIKGNVAYIDTSPSWHNNYYHWMFDVTARFDLLERSGLDIDYYIINPRAYSFQFETLRQLGIPENKIIENHSKLHIRAEKLVLASQPTMLPEWACQYLNRVLKEQQSMEVNEEYKKVYISRSNAARRRVVNEEELIRVLKRKGFTVLVLEELDLMEQVKVFSSADIIISPHGAGLTNLLFVRQGTKLIELFSPAYVHPIYWLLSNRVGADYHYVIGEGVRLQKDLYKNWPTSGGDEDIRINIRKLIKVLRYAGY